jgi:hypothetical protein
MHRLVVVAALFAAACHPAGSPQLRVLGMHAADTQRVVFVQVTNPAGQAMRLTKLDYTFEASGSTVSTGELSLSRDVPADSTVVVEVPTRRRVDPRQAAQARRHADGPPGRARAHVPGRGAGHAVTSDASAFGDALCICPASVRSSAPAISAAIAVHE